MEHKRHLFIPVFLFISVSISGQESKNHEMVFPRGISLMYGKSMTSMRDEYISPETYTGNLNCITASWSWFKNNKGYRVGISNNFSNEVRNNDILADYNQTMLFLDFMYDAGKFSIFSKDAYLYIGPSLELFDYYMNHSFANIIKSESEGSLTSLGVNINLLWQINNWVQPELFLRSNLLSFANKTYDNQRYPNSNSEASLVSFFDANNIHSGLGIRFFPFNKFSIKVDYKLHYSKISEWDDYSSVNNIISATANYTF
ncbi:hypothetical protein ACFLU5_04340 [Bacteroidota bacterium]